MEGPNRVGRMPLVTCLWPGLPQLGSRGEWSGLAVAIGFALLVNVALVASLVWSELLIPGLRIAAWVAVSVFWGVSVVFGYWFIRRQPHDRREETESEFGQAQNHYLEGDWFQTQRILGNLLRRDPRDLEARLMLATMLRHIGRLNEANRQLDQIELIEHSRQWELEINRERQLSADARKKEM